MKQKICRLVLESTPGDRTNSTSVTVWGDAWLEIQASLRGDAALIGDAELRVSGVEHAYALRITDAGEAFNSRTALVKTALPGYGGTGLGGVSFTLEVDSGATFPSGAVAAELILKAPDGHSFIFVGDGGPGFVLTLQHD